MGWRNLFIKIGTKEDETPINTILKFIDHHNNFENYFNNDEIKEMEDEDTIPGETIMPVYIVRESNNGKEYWANVGNGGGSDWTEAWAQKYFPSIKIFNSYNWEHYDDNWINWPTIKENEL